jgi:hypothetical protein
MKRNTDSRRSQRLASDLNSVLWSLHRVVVLDASDYRKCMLPPSSGSTFEVLSFCARMAFCFWKWVHQNSFMHCWALKRAVCATYPTQCSYWSRRCTNPPFPCFFPKQNAIYTQTDYPAHCVLVDGGRMYLRNVGDITRNHTAQQAENRINIEENMPYNCNVCLKMFFSSLCTRGTS